MTINFKTNVKTVIRYKGQEYSSADQLPAEARAAYESAMDKGVAATAAPGVKQQIVLNGQHFASPDEMPAAVRKLYDDAVACVRDSAVSSAPKPEPSPSPNWLTAAQLRLAFLLAAIAGVVAWAYFAH
jgi:hypothetical protein